MAVKPDMLIFDPRFPWVMRCEYDNRFRIDNMAKSPLVSVILPTYNGARYLAAAIESCLTQSFKNFELILVDDYSNDETPAIIAEFAKQDSRIRAIRHKSNLGLPAGLNTGHRASRGEFLTWTSDDNLLRPNFLEELANFLRAHSEVGYVYSDFVVINESGKQLSNVVVVLPEDMIKPRSSIASFLYRRSVYDEVGDYDAHRIYCEDWDYWVRIFLRCKMAPFNKTLYEYRDHSKSLSRTMSVERLTHVEKMWEDYVPHLSRLSASSRSQVWQFLAVVSFRRGYMLKFIYRLMIAAVISPRTVVDRLTKFIAIRVSYTRKSLN